MRLPSGTTPRVTRSLGGLPMACAVAAVCGAGVAQAEPPPPALGERAQTAPATSDRTPDAAPATPACRVTILRAPDRVRAEIEEWVRAERRCRHTLDLRVVPSDDGLYVFARDEDGQIRERVVPDGQSIGALVVSWIADDALADLAPAPAVEAPEVVAPPVPPPPPARASRRLAQPVLDPRIGVVAAMSAARSDRPWLTLASTLSATEPRTFGVRGELDLVRKPYWAAGLAMGQQESVQRSSDTSMTTASAFMAVEGSSGDLQVRLEAGVGIALVWAQQAQCSDTEEMCTSSHGFELRPVSEVAVLLGHRIDDRWSLATGALVLTGIGDLDAVDPARAAFMVFAGLRSRM